MKRRIIQSRGLSVDIWSQMCSLAVVSGVISVALILQIPTPHHRQPASDSLNCNELISRGRCSRFRHLLSEGGDYGSTYGYSYIILYGGCSNAKATSQNCFSLHLHFDTWYYVFFFASTLATAWARGILFLGCPIRLCIKFSRMISKVWWPQKTWFGLVNAVPLWRLQEKRNWSAHRNDEKISHKLLLISVTGWTSMKSGTSHERRCIGILASIDFAFSYSTTVFSQGCCSHFKTR